MYDYKKDDEQLSEKNDDNDDIRDFFCCGNTSSDFKVRKENLPGWAVDWARNRFNMDAKNVKFYVMDEQGADNSVALASGDSVFVTSDHKSDETIIKHELTHIYQQAIGTATESNAGDASLEDEAIQISQEKQFSLAENQTQGNRYILPREKTNVVQSFGALAIAGIALGGAALVAGAVGGITWLAKQIKYKKIMSEIANEIGVPIKTVKNVFKIFSWTNGSIYTEKASKEMCKEMCKKVCNEKASININDLSIDSKKFYNMYKNVENSYKDTRNFEVMDEYKKQANVDLENYATMIENGFKGYDKEESAKYFNFDLKLKRGVYPENKLMFYNSLYLMTNGFTSRKAEDVSDDFKNLFSIDFKSTDWQVYNNNDLVNKYGFICSCTNNFSKVSSKDIGDLNNEHFKSLCIDNKMVDILLLFSNSGNNGKNNLDNLINNIFEIAKILGISKESDEFKNCLLHELGRDPRHNNKKYLSSLVSGGILSVIKELLKTDRYKEIWANKEKNALDKILYGCVEKIEKESNTKEDAQKPEEVKTSSENVSVANVQKKGLPSKISDWEKKDIDNLVDAIIKEVTDTRDLGVISTFKLKEFANVLNIAPNAKRWDVLIHETRTMFSDFQINELKEYASQIIESDEKFKKRKQNGNWDDYHCLVDFISAVRQKIKKEIGTPKVQEFAKALKIKPGTPQWDELLNYEYYMHDISIDMIERHTNWYIKSTPEYNNKNYNWDKEDVQNIVKSVTNRIRNYDIVGDDPRLKKFAKVLDIKPNTPQWDALVTTQNFMEYIPIDKIEKYSNQVINSNEEFEEYKQSGKWVSTVLATFICKVKEKIEKEIGSPRVQEFTKVLKIEPGTTQWKYLLRNAEETRNFYKIPIYMIKDYTEQFIKLHKND